MRRSGFTLIELLVVVAIIALLIGLILPAVSNARALGISTRCLASLRDIGTAVSAYLVANDDHFPLSNAHGGFQPGTAWIDTLMPQTRSKLQYRCPADNAVNFDEPDPAKRRITSYGINAFMSPLPFNYEPTGGPPYGYIVASRLRDVSRRVYVCEVAEADQHGTPQYADHVDPDQWGNNPFGGGGGKQPSWQVALDRHLKRANYNYADGHAEHAAFDVTWKVDPATGDKVIDQWDPGFPHSPQGWYNPEDYVK